MSGRATVAKFHLDAISLAKLAAYQLGKYGNGDFSKADLKPNITTQLEQ